MYVYVCVCLCLCLCVSVSVSVSVRVCVKVTSLRRQMRPVSGKINRRVNPQDSLQDSRHNTAVRSYTGSALNGTRCVCVCVCVVCVWRVCGGCVCVFMQYTVLSLVFLACCVLCVVVCCGGVLLFVFSIHCVLFLFMHPV